MYRILLYKCINVQIVWKQLPAWLAVHDDSHSVRVCICACVKESLRFQTISHNKQFGGNSQAFSKLSFSFL